MSTTTRERYFPQPAGKPAGIDYMDETEKEALEILGVVPGDVYLPFKTASERRQHHAQQASGIESLQDALLAIAKVLSESSGKTDQRLEKIQVSLSHMAKR